ncbi:hypothetical protein ACOSQ2_021392 [Xanthoceras sorbifolium]|uniref:Protein kinase domain-containing protein n=1 Tax=Xanthoceras sorbifolium TaxID=99658 RepID=A0ABQ8HKR4_9ROSI|nr:hypothetical protein JRO89_XS09G0090300 [Xanthoceras sorbifolium]
MTSRHFPPSSNPPSLITKTKLLFLILTISSSIVIIFTLFYFLYHLWYSLVNRSRTIPFDSNAPLKLQRFTYKDLKNATHDFNETNIIGKGGSGTVFLGIGRDGKLFAIKRIDTLSLQTEREFQNELQILGGLRSPFLVTLQGYCVERNNRFLVYEYMPNKSLQEMLFSDGNFVLNWNQRFDIIMDVAKALEFLHFGCDPPVMHGDIKPSNVLLDMDFRAKVSDFGLSRIKVEGEFGVDLFSQDFGKSQDLSGNLATPVEVDFALALQASTSSNNSKKCYNVNIVSESVKGKEVSTIDIGGVDWTSKFVSYEDELSSVDHSKELNLIVDETAAAAAANTKQWGKDWWWRQDGSGELSSKDYVTEWIGSQICPSSNPDWEEEKKNNHEKSELDNVPRSQEPVFEKLELKGRKHMKIQEWWKEEHLDEISNKKKKKKKKKTKLRNLEIKWNKGIKIPHFDLGKRFRFRFHGRKKFREQKDDECDANGEFSFRRGYKKNKKNSMGSDMWSGDIFSRELSSTTSMRGTLCYVAPEYGGCGYLIEKADIYSLGVLILVIVSGRRPLHVLASPMKLEKANLISWCRQLAQAGNILELVDERLKDEYNKEQASLCINLALTCLQRTPELRPDIAETVKILKGEMDLPPLPFEFSPSPPSSKLYNKSRRRHKANPE